MRTTIRLCLVAGMCAWLAACAGGQDPKAPAPVPADAPAADRAVGLFERLAYDLDTTGKDCDKVAARFSSFNQSYQSNYPALASQAGQSPLSPEDRAAHDRRLRIAMSKILAAVDRCAEHAGAQKAFTEFDVLVDPR